MKLYLSAQRKRSPFAWDLMSILVFWLGLMKIAEESGLLDKLSNLFKPFMRWLFPEVPPNHPAMGYILSNMMANTFGLGNAATPLGIKAMEQLKETKWRKSNGQPLDGHFFSNQYLKRNVDSNYCHCDPHELRCPLPDGHRISDHNSNGHFCRWRNRDRSIFLLQEKEEREGIGCCTG